MSDPDLIAGLRNIAKHFRATMPRCTIVLELAAARVEKARDDDETHRLQLAGISTASIQNTEKTRKDRIGPESPYYTTAYGDVCRAVDREMSLRYQLANASADESALIADLRQKSEQQINALREQLHTQKDALKKCQKDFDELAKRLEARMKKERKR